MTRPLWWDDGTYSGGEHPGLEIKQIIESYRSTQVEAAHKLGISPAHLSDVLRGNRGITPRLAVALSRYCGLTPVYWLKAQQEYDLYQQVEECRRIDAEQEAQRKLARPPRPPAPVNPPRPVNHRPVA